MAGWFDDFFSDQVKGWEQAAGGFGRIFTGDISGGVGQVVNGDMSAITGGYVQSGDYKTTEQDRADERARYDANLAYQQQQDQMNAANASAKAMRDQANKPKFGRAATILGGAGSGRTLTGLSRRTLNGA